MENPPRMSFRPDWQRGVALAVLTAIGLYLCYRITVPFLPGITWAVALAIVGLPLHQQSERLIGNRNWAAGLTTMIVVLVIAIPVFLVTIQLAAETNRATVLVQQEAREGRWQEHASRIPYVGERLAQIDPDELEARIRAGAAYLANRSLGVIEGVVGGLLQSLVAVFVLFFCFRDRHHLIDEVKRLLPLGQPDSRRIIKRAEDAVHATVYGTLLTAAIQGVSGGLLFWAIGLPAPVLWGAIMFVLGVLPFVGAFLVWVPAALFLASNDRWWPAAAVVAWGLTMAGPVCNYIYACAAGDRMRIHAVPTLIAFIGGLAVFGISGMVLGPCILAVTVALLDVWRFRSADNMPVESNKPITPVMKEASLDQTSA